MTDTREHLSQAIIGAGRLLYSRGWSPATSSNYSARLTSAEALLTVSGKHKGQLTTNLLSVDIDGRSLEEGKKPSAETLLHTQLYRCRPEIGAVLHTHSVNAPCSRACVSVGMVSISGARDGRCAAPDRGVRVPLRVSAN